MKYLLLLLNLVVTLNVIIADCGIGLRIYPEREIISPNTNFIIENHSYNPISEILRELDKVYPIYLESENQKIRLIKKSILEDRMGFIQAIFYPECELIAGERYSLKIENVESRAKDFFENKTRYDFNKGKMNTAKNWLVSNKNDFEPPIVKQSPEYLENKINYYGCGTAINAIFECDINDESEILFLTEFHEIETGKVIRYFVKPHEGKLYIGIGMCGGAFIYQREFNYKVRFKVFDINGNTDSDWTEEIVFENPFCNNS